MKQKKIYVDIDNTICSTIGNDYKNSVPIPENIEKINKLHDLGYKIIYWSVRGRSSGIDHRKLTLQQLRIWGCKFHSLDLKTKPEYNTIIDDRAINIDEL